MKITAQVVILNKEGLVLGVSRKTNHNDFGLVGGKMDPEDNDDPIATAIRETREETGLHISNLRLIFAIHKDGFMGYTYLADYEGEINHNEPHVVKWVPFSTLIEGSFGRYNKLVSESLDDMGIKYLKRPIPKDQYMFAVIQAPWDDYPHICLTPVKYWKKHKLIPDSWTDKQWGDIHNLSINGNLGLGELDEASFEVNKDGELLKTKESIIEAMVAAGFIYDEKFDSEINS